MSKKKKKPIFVQFDSTRTIAFYDTNTYENVDFSKLVDALNTVLDAVPDNNNSSKAWRLTPNVKSKIAEFVGQELNNKPDTPNTQALLKMLAEHQSFVSVDGFFAVSSASPHDGDAFIDEILGYIEDFDPVLKAEILYNIRSANGSYFPEDDIVIQKLIELGTPLAYEKIKTFSETAGDKDYKQNAFETLKAIGTNDVIDLYTQGYGAAGNQGSEESFEQNYTKRFSKLMEFVRIKDADAKALKASKKRLREAIHETLPYFIKSSDIQAFIRKYMKKDGLSEKQQKNNATVLELFKSDFELAAKQLKKPLKNPLLDLIQSSFDHYELEQAMTQNSNSLHASLEKIAAEKLEKA